MEESYEKIQKRIDRNSQKKAERIPITEFPPYPTNSLVKYGAVIGTSLISASLIFGIFQQSYLWTTAVVLFCGVAILIFSIRLWIVEEELRLANYVWHISRLLHAQLGDTHFTTKDILRELYSTRKGIKDEIRDVEQWANGPSITEIIKQKIRRK